MPSPVTQFPSPRTILKFEALQPQITTLALDWLERVDRTAPVPPGALHLANGLLIAARNLLSREPEALYVAPVPERNPVMPGDLLVALLKAQAALVAWADRYSHVSDNQRDWHFPRYGHCPHCGAPTTPDTPAGEA